MRHKALLAWRSPPRLSRWRWVRPEDAGIGGGAAQVGEGGLGAQPLGVVAGGDQQLPGGVDPDPGQGDQGGRDRGDQVLELGVELVELGLELLPAAGQGPQAGLGGRRWCW